MIEALDFLKLFGGFVYLLLGGDLLVRGALGLAKESNIPPMVVGLTVVAMGTSAPELMVSAFSALSGHADIAVGNIIGSNIANVLLVIGVPVLIYPIMTNQEGLSRQTSIMIAVLVLFILLCFFSPFSLLDGILLLFLLACFLIGAMRGAALIPLDDVEEELDQVLGIPARPWTIGLFVVAGVVTLPLGANLAVEGAAGLASNWGVSEAVIGLSLVALGTSLPELSTTVLAALHKSSDVAIGNVIGSNMFNILAIMGFTAMLTDVPVDPDMLKIDIWVMLFASVVLWIYVLNKATIGKMSGIVFLLGYVGYIVSIYI